MFGTEDLQFISHTIMCYPLLTQLLLTNLLTYIHHYKVTTQLIIFTNKNNPI